MARTTRRTWILPTEKSNHIQFCFSITSTKAEQLQKLRTHLNIRLAQPSVEKDQAFRRPLWTKVPVEPQALLEAVKYKINCPPDVSYKADL